MDYFFLNSKIPAGQQNQSLSPTDSRSMSVLEKNEGSQQGLPPPLLDADGFTIRQEPPSDLFESNVVSDSDEGDAE